MRTDRADELMREVGRLAAERDAARGALEAYGDGSEEVAELRTQLQRYSRELAGAQMDRAYWRSRAEERAGELRRLRESNTDPGSTRLAAENVELRDRVERLRHEVRTIATAAQRAAQERDELRDDVKELGEELVKAGGRRAGMESELSKLSGLLTLREGSLERWRERAEAAEEAERCYRQDLKEKEDIIERAIQVLDEHTDPNEKLAVLWPVLEHGARVERYIDEQPDGSSRIGLRHVHEHSNEAVVDPSAPEGEVDCEIVEQDGEESPPLVLREGDTLSLTFRGPSGFLMNGPDDVPEPQAGSREPDGHGIFSTANGPEIFDAMAEHQMQANGADDVPEPRLATPEMTMRRLVEQQREQTEAWKAQMRDHAGEMQRAFRGLAESQARAWARYAARFPKE